MALACFKWAGLLWTPCSQPLALTQPSLPVSPGMLAGSHTAGQELWPRRAGGHRRTGAPASQAAAAPFRGLPACSAVSATLAAARSNFSKIPSLPPDGTSWNLLWRPGPALGVHQGSQENVSSRAMFCEQQLQTLWREGSAGALLDQGSHQQLGLEPLQLQRRGQSTGDIQSIFVGIELIFCGVFMHFAASRCKLR